MDIKLDSSDELRGKLDQIARLEEEYGLLGFRILPKGDMMDLLKLPVLGTHKSVDTVLEAARDIPRLLSPKHPRVVDATRKGHVER